MKVLLVRHAKKARDLPEVDDRNLPLSKEGVMEVQGLAEEFAKKGLRPNLYLSSRYAHAIETARLLAEHLGGGSVAEVVPIDALTPHYPYTFSLIVREAAELGFGLGSLNTVGMALHYPRIHQLTAELTSSPIEQEDPGYAAATCVAADSLESLLAGQGHTCQLWRRSKEGILTTRDYSTFEHGGI